MRPTTPLEVLQMIAEEYTAEGRQQGLRQGLQMSIRLALKIKFGLVGEVLMSEIVLIEDMAMLRAFNEFIEVAKSTEELRVWLAQRAAV